MATYPGDRRLVSIDEQISIVLDSDQPMSFSDYGDVLRDLETLFNFSAREVSARLRGTNVRKRDALLAIRDFRIGSLEIIANPYFQGVVTGLMATAISSAFVYVARRINGRPETPQQDPLLEVDSATIGQEKLREAASQAVTRTAPARRRLKNKIKTFGLSIKIKVGQRDYDVS